MVGIAYLLTALQIPVGTIRQPGPGLFPTIVGLLVVVAAAGALWQSWPKAPDGQPVGPHGSEDDETDPRRAIALLAVALVYPLAAGPLGHVIASWFVAAASIRLAGGRAILQIVVISLLLAVLSYYLFDALGMRLPSGTFWPTLFP